LLLERPYEVVTREEIQQKLWPADTYVAFDDGLNTAIKKLRLALGDSADNPRFIETVPRRGYRFLAAPNITEQTAQTEVAAETAEPVSTGLQDQDPDTTSDAPQVIREFPKASWGRRVLPWAAAMIVVGVVATGWTVWEKTRNETESSAARPGVRAAQSGRDARRSIDPRAHEEYLLARNFWKLRTAEALAQAVDHFNLAIEHDPSYAEAHAGLANCYVVMPMLSTVPAADTYLRARQEADKALALDDSVAEAHLAAAEVKLYSDWNFAGAEVEFRRALELDSNDAQAHQWYAEFLSLMGRHQEAISEIHVAQHLDPLSMIIHHQAGQIYQNARMYGEAYLEYRKALMIQPGFGPTYASMALAYRRQGRYEESVEAQRQANRYWDPGGTAVEDLKRVGDAYSAGGKTAYLRAAIESSKKHPGSPYDAAFEYALLGNDEQALRLLEKSLEERLPQMINLLNDPEFDHLKANPRFQEIVKKVGLVPPKATGESLPPLRR
jgi:DNA-binding winged helix-turn-helix (wHTH) protein/Tfp pilus assembly protein PilF